jgi:2,4-dienoyl-CoA reductase (NADPH2)
MSRHTMFAFRSSDEIIKKASELQIELPYQKDLSPLFEKISLGSKKLSNRLAVQPMEGYDADPDGSPGELTFRRYERFARGGSALIWFEATSVVSEGRSNPRQLWLHSNNGDGFAKLVERVRREAKRSLGPGHNVCCVLQLTHSGRYSKPEGTSQPHVASYNPILDGKKENLHILTDEELDVLQDIFVDTAYLAAQAGFDAVDIKACHGYLVNDLLAAFGRQDSKYGGPFDNRVRFLEEVVKKIRYEVPQINIAVRMNVFDGIPFPYGFGISRDESGKVDLGEPIKVVSRLVDRGCSLLNVTAGIPFLMPHIGRPYDRPVRGSPKPGEHPLEGVARLISLTARFQKEFPELPVIGTGYSWLRHFFPNVGAAALQNGLASFVGLGRSAIDYPDAPKDLLSIGILDPKKTCISCSRCTEMMRMGGNAGCVMRDEEIYGKKYRILLRERMNDEKKHDRS